MTRPHGLETAPNADGAAATGRTPGTAESTDADAAEPKPFKALLTASSFIVVVLGVAGFSLRWNYYYNFGLQHVVAEAPLSSLAVAAVEIIRRPENIRTALLLAAEFLLPFEIALWVARRIARSGRVADWARWTNASRTALLAEVVRATLIVFVAFRAGGIAGSRDYLLNAIEDTSSLPRVTAIANAAGGEAGEPLAVACDTRPLLERTPTTLPAFIGDPQAIIRLRGAVACSSETQSWRLLFRDERFTYIFLTVTQPGRRPETLVLPNTDRLTLVLQ